MVCRSYLFTPKPSGVRSGVLLSLKIDRAVDRRNLAFRAEMGAPHDHLKCPVPEQLCNHPQIDSGHNKSTGKRVAVAMPRITRHLRLIEGCREPSARSLLRGVRKGRLGRSPTGLLYPTTDRAQPGRPGSAESPADRHSWSLTDATAGARDRPGSSEASTARSSASRCEAIEGNGAGTPRLSWLNFSPATQQIVVDACQLDA
jgi:hypothetical protein